MVGPGRGAFPSLPVGMPDQFVAGRDAAGPFFSLRVEADLIGLRRIYSREANFHLTDLDGIAVNNARNAGDLAPKTGACISARNRTEPVHNFIFSGPSSAHRTSTGRSAIFLDHRLSYVSRVAQRRSPSGPRICTPSTTTPAVAREIFRAGTRVPGCVISIPAQLHDDRGDSCRR